jgi:hypothetical protein
MNSAMLLTEDSFECNKWCASLYFYNSDSQIENFPSTYSPDIFRLQYFRIHQVLFTDVFSKLGS